MNLSQMQYYKQILGYSYDKLSEVSGVPKGTLQKIFTGVTVAPRHDTLLAIERALKEGIYDDEGSADKNLLMESDDADVSGLVREAAPKYNAKDMSDGSSGHNLEDYYALPDDVRVEMIDGVFFYMDAPTSIHQIISFQVAHMFENFIEENEGDCVPYVAPCDVQLDCDDKTMVEPDMFVLCDRKKNKTRCIYGAPEFVLEVLSKSTSRKDRTLKHFKYANAGVREYWIVDPFKEQVIVYLFESGQNEEDYDEEIHIYTFNDKIPVEIYKGKLEIDFNRIKKRIGMAVDNGK